MTEPSGVLAQVHFQDDGSYAGSRFNATSHGLTAKQVILPWEDPNEFKALQQAFLAEHMPQGITEELLVAELATLFWRKMRVLQAENAEIRDGLRESLCFTRGETVTQAALAHQGGGRRDLTTEAVCRDKTEAEDDLAGMMDVKARTEKAMRIIHRGGVRAYERALKALHTETREWWLETIDPDEDDESILNDSDEPYHATNESLSVFLENEVLTWCENRIAALKSRPLVRSQAFGMAVQRANLEKISRYETALDRKMQRILGTLLRLQDARRTVNAASA